MLQFAHAMRLGVLVLLLARTALAQPALMPTAPPLTAEDREILDAGPIDSGAYTGGVAAALTLGFGSGQAVQGRWRDTGWIFTVGEAASFGVMALAWPSSNRLASCVSSCQAGSESVAIGAIVALLAIHTWEIGDAIIAPALRNQRFRRVTNRYGTQPYYTMKPFLAPRGDGALAGVDVSF